MGEKFEEKSLPIFTWIVPFFVFLAGAMISNLLKVPGNSALFYLPIPLGIILIHWWGPRILVGLFTNSAIVASGSLSFSDWIVEATHVSICVFISWLLFTRLFNGKAWLPNIKAIIQFLGLGIVIPITVNAIFNLITSSGPHAIDQTVIIWASDFASSFALSLPVLFFLTPVMEKFGLTQRVGSEYIRPSVTFRLFRPYLFEIGVSTLALFILRFMLPLERYWFIYGIFTVHISLRFGFNNAILANLLIFLVTYILPFMTIGEPNFSWALESNLINVHMGMCLLSVTACITGRVISDLKSAEQKMSRQYLELERANRELDRFVYSASHDLSAPLKSILGLINLSRIEKNSLLHIEYINKMGISIHKLENFIQEILDYSRNARTHLTPEQIKIEDLVLEVVDNLKFIEGFDTMDIRTGGIRVPEIFADRARLKIIFNNLISNSIKYRRIYEGHRPFVEISSELSLQFVKIYVSDNGQGIHPSVINKIFNMFFRGSSKSSGSGLGLYIAKEAVEKMHGKIDVLSHYGEGSTFAIYLPIEKPDRSPQQKS